MEVLVVEVQQGVEVVVVVVIMVSSMEVPTFIAITVSLSKT